MAGGKQHPELSEDARAELLRHARYKPLEPYPGQSKPWKVLCLRCDMEVFQRVIALEAADVKRVASGFGRTRMRCNHLGAREPGGVRPVSLTVEEAVAIRDMIELARACTNQSGPPELGSALGKLRPLIKRAERESKKKEA
jgi:hypothetical protein